MGGYRTRRHGLLYSLVWIPIKYTFMLVWLFCKWTVILTWRAAKWTYYLIRKFIVYILATKTRRLVAGAVMAGLLMFSCSLVAASSIYNAVNPSPTPTSTFTATITLTPSQTSTITYTPTETSTLTPTTTLTPSSTPTINLTPSTTPTRTPRPTDTLWPTAPPANTLASYFTEQPTLDSQPGGDQVCCKVCSSNSKPCGKSCISLDKTCHQAPGCACQAK